MAKNQTFKKIKLTSEQLKKGMDIIIQDIIDSNAKNAVTEENNENLKRYIPFVREIIEVLKVEWDKNKNLFTDFDRHGWDKLSFANSEFLKNLS